MQQWIHEDPSHLAYYNQLKQVWETSRQLAVSSKADENKAWQRFQSRLHKKDEKPDVHQPKSRYYPLGWRIAAAILIIISVIGLKYWLAEPGKTQTDYVYTEDEVKKDTLPDGSVVTLNRNSSLSYTSKSSDKTRKVRLEGEAFFNVTPDKNKPFIITVNNTLVKVVGTSFNIKENKGVTEVIVETGVVQITKAGKTIELKANERIAVSDSTAFTKQTTQDKLYNYYRSKQFVCDNTPLWKLAQVLSEAYTFQVIIGREELKNLPLNTTFNDESLDRVLQLIAMTFESHNIKIVWGEHGVVLQ